MIVRRTNVNIADTPVAPYLNLLNGMNRNEKIALASFLLDSLSGVKIVFSVVIKGLRIVN